MYSYTRQEAADTLGISTRSVDRYIKAGKLRSQKQGKIIYINTKDVDNMSGKHSSTRSEVIIPASTQTNQSRAYENESSPVQQQVVRQNTESSQALEKIYLDLRSEIKQKDQAIQDLSLQLGKAQEIAKNSVSLVEFKKSQFLLEESKSHIAQELTSLKETNEELQDKLKYEKSTNYLLIGFCVVLMIGLGLVWFIRI